jgi:hypothetical protein
LSGTALRLQISGSPATTALAHVHPAGDRECERAADRGAARCAREAGALDHQPLDREDAQ